MVTIDRNKFHSKLVLPHSREKPTSTHTSHDAVEFTSRHDTGGHTAVKCNATQISNFPSVCADQTTPIFYKNRTVV